MIKVALTCATILIAFAGVRPASAAEGQCYSCCGGLTAGGTCISMCTGSCPTKHQMVAMTKQCDQQSRTLVCSGPRCTWMCNKSTH
jgi:hypothetical protein